MQVFRTMNGLKSIVRESQKQARFPLSYVKIIIQRGHINEYQLQCRQ